MTPITILGAGNSGLAMAAHLSLQGYPVHLWSRSASTLSALADTRQIKVAGVFEGVATLAKVTTNLEEALAGSELVLVTTPANAHIDLATGMSRVLDRPVTIVLNPGRTFGALEFAHALKQKGCTIPVSVAETQTIIYTCRKTSPEAVSVLEMKHDVLLSGRTPQETESVLKALPAEIRQYLKPAASMIQTSIGNVGMILHCAPTVLNTGWIETRNVEFKYYYQGITPSIADLLEQLDSERMEVSRVLGQEVESTADWLKRSYGIRGDSLYACIQNNTAYSTIDAPHSLQHRYIFEDIPCGLVPIEAIGRKLGLQMRVTTLVIDLASLLVKTDLRAIGRNLERLGVADNSLASIKALFAQKEIA